ncbi:MAG: hypothetical protein IPG53_11905 [Ignavibacteriales bacterium]|nr:hypothetical protein [Ignavibacteriales bacterium]
MAKCRTSNSLPWKWSRFVESECNRKSLNLITYHSAKGLDFEVTFLPFLTKERYMPSGNIPGESLFFVALTRATGADVPFSQ